MAPHHSQRRKAQLTQKEADIWRRAVAVVMTVGPMIETDLQKAGSLSFFEFQVLSALHDADGALTMSQLAERCNSSLSRLSHVARKLEERDVIIRTPATSDKRVTMAELTPQGEKEVEKVQGRYADSVRRRVLSVFDDEDLETIDDLFSQLLEEIDPDHWLLDYEDEEDD
ncbi:MULTISPECIES: MarR family winged helix-turn-helix transcriptional regulator [Auritidibacter]|uniref:MarR family transcriptional regulator n=2 Tax=Micrococcaceae TaxID=1268 RepID=A0AAJ6AL99_9MICC|nr:MULTISPECIES: MarR family transcriptional regulator [Auritidibacter]PXA80792.1 MarR family transcriptional regulator [Auritidibacter sp. NML120779]PXA81094.1 MarR family transcriptional regulator [Auritidibacter sp. NML120636]AXR74822.1 MarR family transcriptional regulator [Auritidibacter sp. NML130574]NIH71235.1 DNA-binding MarR family transcriptional regulator [Auritidibacter ignavus]PXA78328.1 MarR family transcriptional regulator [Auritidibacter sp. NML100628]